MTKSNITEREIIRVNKKAIRNIQTSEKYMKKLYSESRKNINNKIMLLADKVNSWNYEDVIKYNRYQTLLLDIENEISVLGGKEVRYLQDRFADMYKDNYLHFNYALGKKLNVKINLTSINKKAVDAIVNFPYNDSMFSDRVWANKGKMVARLKKGVTKSLIEGDSITKTAKYIKKGVDASLYECERLVRTESMRICAKAEDTTFEENRVKKVQFWATIPSERTCDSCGKLHEKIFIRGREEELPIHPNCRCTYLPVISQRQERVNELTEKIRSSRNFGEFKNKLEKSGI